VVPRLFGLVKNVGTGVGSDSSAVAEKRAKRFHERFAGKQPGVREKTGKGRTGNMTASPVPAPLGAGSTTAPREMAVGGTNLMRKIN